MAIREITDRSNFTARVETVEKERQRLNWVTILTMIIFHLGAVTAFFYWDRTAFAMALLLLWISGSWGIGIGYHRLLTHRGFKTSKAFEYFLTICGTLALEGGPINWVATHRIHHARADKGGDPHSPRDGRWWSHIGWILVGTAQQHDEATLRRFAPDLMKDRTHRVINRFYFVPLIALGLGLFLLGGVPMVLWGIFFRVTVGLHATWLVNSATHMWGTQRFATGDDSRNNWWVALLTFGEGWHNNHHAHPTSARHGLGRFEIDVNWLTIRLFQTVGLVRDVKLPARR